MVIRVKAQEAQSVGGGPRNDFMEQNLTRQPPCVSEPLVGPPSSGVVRLVNIRTREIGREFYNNSKYEYNLLNFGHESGLF